MIRFAPNKTILLLSQLNEQHSIQWRKLFCMIKDRHYYETWKVKALMTMFSIASQCSMSVRTWNHEQPLFSYSAYSKVLMFSMFSVFSLVSNIWKKLNVFVLFWRNQEFESQKFDLMCKSKQASSTNSFFTWIVRANLQCTLHQMCIYISPHDHKR